MSKFGTGISVDLINSIPPALLSKLPAASPPPGVVSNFDNPASRANVLLGLTSTFLGLAVISYAIRMYTKIRVFHKVTWDDFTITMGLLCGITFYTSIVIGVSVGVIGRHTWDLHLDKVISQKSLYVAWLSTIIAIPASGFVKMSLFLQYYALFKVKRYVRISVYIAGTLTGAFYSVLTILYFAICSPRPGESMLALTLSKRYLQFANMSLAVGIISMILDWILLVPPISAVWKIQLSTPKKLGVILVFATGGLATAASVTCLYYRVLYQNDASDPFWTVSYISLWTEIEFFAGITAACMPTTRQLLVRHNVLPTFDKSYFTPRLANLRIRTSEFLKKTQSSSFTKTSSTREASSGRTKAKRNSLDQWGYVSELKPEEDGIRLTTCTTNESDYQKHTDSQRYPQSSRRQRYEIYDPYGATIGNPFYPNFQLAYFNQGNTPLSADYTGYADNVDFVLPWSGASQILALPPRVNTFTSLVFQGYFAANQTSVWNFTLFSNDDVTYLFMSPEAYRDGSESNGLLRDTRGNINSYAANFIASQYVPMTIVYANGPQTGCLQLGIVDPAGVYYNSTAGLFR